MQLAFSLEQVGNAKEKENVRLDAKKLLLPEPWEKYLRLLDNDNRAYDALHRKHIIGNCGCSHMPDS